MATDRKRSPYQEEKNNRSIFESLERVGSLFQSNTSPADTFSDVFGSFTQEHADLDEADKRFATGEDVYTALRNGPVAVAPNVDFGSIRNMPIGERQRTVAATIPQAADAAGVSPDMMRGLWGVESGFGKGRLSSTGCLGDWQFTKGTWAFIIEKYGDQIPSEAARAYAGMLKEGAIKKNDAGLQALRDDPVVSTYAAAFYGKDIARGLSIDPKDPSNYGKIYAAYNVGPASLKKLMDLEKDSPMANAKTALGYVADVNPMFYRNGATASQALANYQGAVETRLKDYNRLFGDTAPVAARSDIKAKNPVQTAFSASASGMTVDEKRAQEEQPSVISTAYETARSWFADQFEMANGATKPAEATVAAVTTPAVKPAVTGGGSALTSNLG